MQHSFDDVCNGKDYTDMKELSVKAVHYLNQKNAKYFRD